MKPEFKVRTSNELTSDEWKLIVDGFNETFERDYSVERMQRYYHSSALGHCFHVLTFRSDTGEFLGSTSVFPYFYYDGEQVILTGLNGGSFILKKARTNPVIYRDTYQALRRYCQEAGLKFVIGIPNDNLFRYSTKVMPFKYVYDLPYFVLPVRPSMLSSKLRFANGLYWIVLNLWLLVQTGLSLIFNPREKSVRFRILNDEKFYQNRFFKDYQRISFEPDNGFGIYKIFDEGKYRVAYVFDFRREGVRDWRGLIKTVRHIVRHEKVDAVSFIGDLRLRQFTLLPLPAKRIPQRLPFTVDILDEGLQAALVDRNSWNFSLMNFDAR